MAVSLSQTAAGSDNTSSQTTKTLSSKSIGTAASDRLIFFGVTTDGLSTAVSVTSVTIGGISAASTGAAYNPTSLTAARMQFWWALVSSGTTASVVVNFSGLCDRTAEIDWALYRVVGADTASPLSGSPVTATGTSPINGSLTIPTNGCGIAAGKSNLISPDGFTWTNLTEDTDASGAMTGRRYTFASSTSAGTATRTLTGGAGQGEGLYMIAIAEAVDTLAPQQLRFM